MTLRNHKKWQKKTILELSARGLAPITWASMVLWLSLTSHPPQIPGVLGWDKLLHAGAYGLLSFLIAQALLCLPGNRHDRIWWYAGLTAVGYGGLLEILQLLALTGRTAEWWDLFADAVGATLSCVIFRQAYLLYSRRYGHSGKQDG
jgi:VanZ family protein